MKADHHQFAALLHRSAALWRIRLDERLRPWGMTQATWRALWALRQAEERYDQSRLAARLGIETPTLVGLLDRMEKRGLLRREADPLDRRRKYLAITPQGLALAEEIEGEVLATRAAMLDGVDEADLEAGLRLCRKLLDNAAAMDNKT